VGRWVGWDMGIVLLKKSYSCICTVLISLLTMNKKTFEGRIKKCVVFILLLQIKICDNKQINLN